MIINCTLRKASSAAGKGGGSGPWNDRRGMRGLNKLRSIRWKAGYDDVICKQGKLAPICLYRLHSSFQGAPLSDWLAWLAAVRKRDSC